MIRPMMLMLHISCLLLCATFASARIGHVPTDYNNNGLLIDSNFLSSVASFSVKELRSDSRLTGVTTELTTGACRSCHRQVFEGDRLHLLIEVFEKGARSNSSPLQHCSVVLTVKIPLSSNFELKYIECANESASRPSGDGQSKSKHLLGGWNMADANSDDVVNAAIFASGETSGLSNSIKRFVLHSVVKAATQIVAGVNYQLDFIVRSTPCGNTPADIQKTTFECDLLDYSTQSGSDAESNTVEFQYCSALVWYQPWQDPQYSITQLTCKPAGMAIEKQQVASAWFDCVTSRFKLGDSQWSFFRASSDQASSASPAIQSQLDPDWFALFTLSGTPMNLALQFRAFATRFNRTYLSLNASSAPVAAEINLRYFRFSQNAARMKVARLAEVGTATYNLSTNPFADVSLQDFCVALSNIAASQQISSDESTDTAVAATSLSLPPEQLAIVQFYEANIVQTWPPMFSSALFRLVRDAHADSDCSYVITHVRLLGSTPCSQIAAERPCTLSYQLIELGAKSLASSAQLFFRLSLES